MNSIPRVRVTGNFIIGSGAVTLTVVIGEAQQGFTAVLLGDEPIVEGENLQDEMIGAPADLRGQILFLDTVVTVINPLTTRTSVQFILRQGNMERSFPGSRTLNALGDSVIYEGEIDFQ